MNLLPICDLPENIIQEVLWKIQIGKGIFQMFGFRSREKYNRWKAGRAKKFQSRTDNDKGKPSGEEKGGSSSCCFECGTEIGNAGNFCPHCGISLKNRNNDSVGELQKDTVFQNISSRIKEKFSPGLTYYRIKGLMRMAITCLIVYSVLSLFFGGKVFRALNEKIYDVFTYAADKSQSNGYELSGTVLVGSREKICSFVDYLACQSDKLGILDRYITAIKMEREKEGEKIAEGLKLLKKIQADPEQR